jgi:pyruvate dehydrogenase E2 component (dihydrolipoamide acetyltransferase)
MPTNILMPALSPTMEKGNLSKWLKKEGDVIKSGDVLAEIETDKATMEVESIDDGILAKIVVAAGTADVLVNQLIAIIAADGEDVSKVAAGSVSVVSSSSSLAGELAASAVGGGGSPLPSPALTPTPQVGGRESNSPRIFASPLAKRIASQNNIDLSKINGSGPHGRIVEADVNAAISGGSAVKSTQAPAAKAAATPSTSQAPAADDAAIKKMFADGSYVEIPHDGMRKTIARRLMESKLTVPHFYLTVDTNLDALLGLREQLNAAAPMIDGKPAYKLSVNDIVIKAMAMALKAVPDANVSWTESAMLKHKTADVGVAVSIPGGLITPIVRAACQKSLSTISNEMKDMAVRAKTRKLKPEEYQGGTTAVSNLGMFGVKDFCAIINPPHATILAVGAGEKRPVVKSDGSVGVATVMSVTLSTDHRAVDGALGAELLRAFKTYIENPLGMLV